MNKNEFEIPIEIRSLIESGIWPKNEKESIRQNIHILISKENLKKIAPDEEYIYFYPPPFEIVESSIEKQKEFWIEYGAIDSIVPEKCIIIGDFGLGSDAAIILDYSEDKKKPSVKRQVWSKEGNYWEIMANSFSDFIKLIELENKK